MKRLGILFVLSIITDLHAQDRPLHERSIDEIIREYTIIGDFNMKPELRDNSKEIFWRYPIALPRVEFSLDIPDLDKPEDQLMFPRTDGVGREMEHLNRGRVYFLNKDYEEARKTWLSGRARYGKKYDYHRRTDYFIANSFLQIGKSLLEKNKYNYNHDDVRAQLVNTSTFLSWTYGVKKEIPDPIVDKYAPLFYYNLATIYFRYERWSPAYGALQDALDFLRRTGRKEKRSEFRRMQAELFIRNRDYLNAAQELDLALRQDQDVNNVGQIFARLGDIYFDLNNFELAEDMYAMAIRVDKEKNQIRPWQYILRGESLFWLGKFSLAQKMMNYGLSIASSSHVVQELSNEMQALASIRIADSWLALGELDKARLAYFQHYTQFREHGTANAARLREACLELPFYKGNNISHARVLLNDLKLNDASMPPVAKELIWTCELGSYAQHERSQELIERVRAFYQLYPRSDFLNSLVGPMREVQSKNLDEYFTKGDQYGAIDFFEKTRKFLFPTIKDEIKTKLFSAYANVYQPEKALEFIEQSKTATDVDYIRKAMVLSESPKEVYQKIYRSKNHSLAKSLINRDWTIEPNKETKLFIDRILSSNFGSIHYSWIYDLGRDWVEKDFEAACSVVYPVLQRIGEDTEHVSLLDFQLMAHNFIEKYLEDLLKYDTFCGYSVLEFEMELFKDQPEKLGEKYLTRNFMQVNQVTAALFFSLGEINYSSGNTEIARKIWEKIVKDGDPNLPEVRYAKSRLDNRRTETDKLWE